MEICRKDEREAALRAHAPEKQDGFTLWMTGLPRPGMSTLAGVLKEKHEKEHRAARRDARR